MNKLIILICMILIPLHINAISINEIRNNPSQFKLVYSDETREAYVDNSTISVTRYNILYSNSLWIINYFTIIIILAINLTCGKYYFSYFTTFYN